MARVRQIAVALSSSLLRALSDLDRHHNCGGHSRTVHSVLHDTLTRRTARRRNARNFTILSCICRRRGHSLTDHVISARRRRRSLSITALRIRVGRSSYLRVTILGNSVNSIRRFTSSIVTRHNIQRKRLRYLPGRSWRLPAHHCFLATRWASSGCQLASRFFSRSLIPRGIEHFSPLFLPFACCALRIIRSYP